MWLGEAVALDALGYEWGFFYFIYLSIIRVVKITLIIHNESFMKKCAALVYV